MTSGFQPFFVPLNQPIERFLNTDMESRANVAYDAFPDVNFPLTLSQYDEDCVNRIPIGQTSPSVY